MVINGTYLEQLNLDPKTHIDCSLKDWCFLLVYKELHNFQYIIPSQGKRSIKKHLYNCSSEQRFPFKSKHQNKNTERPRNNARPRSGCACEDMKSGQGLETWADGSSFKGEYRRLDGRRGVKGGHASGLLGSFFKECFFFVFLGSGEWFFDVFRGFLE